MWIWNSSRHLLKWTILLQASVWRIRKSHLCQDSSYCWRTLPSLQGYSCRWRDEDQTKYVIFRCIRPLVYKMCLTNLQQPEENNNIYVDYISVMVRISSKFRLTMSVSDEQVCVSNARKCRWSSYVLNFVHEQVHFPTFVQESCYNQCYWSINDVVWCKSNSSNVCQEHVSTYWNKLC